MDGKTIVILGGGFGGVSVASELRRNLGKEHRIVVIDRKRKFSMGFANLWLMAGIRKDTSEGVEDLATLRNMGIEFLNEEIVSIKPAEKSVKTSSGVINADYLVISLGAELDPDAVEGFRENAYNFYDRSGSVSLGSALKEFDSGRIAVVVSSVPFKCPVAPYEAALMLDSMLRNGKKRESASLDLYTPEPAPVLIGGQEIGRTVVKMLSDRGIGYHPSHSLKKIDGEMKKLVFDGGDYSYDLVAGVPVHRAPEVVKEAGLTDASGWVPVDPHTAETEYPGVFAIGDVTSVRLKNGMYLPKSAVFAEGEGNSVVTHITSLIKDGVEAKTYGGYGYCFFETGEGLNAPVSGEFYSSPVPELTMEVPNETDHSRMLEFESSRLKRWFHTR